MKYLKVRNDLFLIQKDIIIGDKQPETSTVNHIWIYDRSGSMYCTLSRLVEDLITRAKQLPIGDTLTLGWFSSEGNYNFIIKGFKITDSSDYIILENMLRKNNTTIALTCFSEILGSTKQVIEDLKVFSDRFALCFFTDGYPVVSNYSKEISNIFSAIKNIEGEVTSSLMVGYGNYYNKQLMTKMAEAFGGSLCHSDSLPTFNIQLNDFIENSKNSDNKVSIKIDATPTDTIFGINGSSINVYPVDGDGMINFTPLKKMKNNIYILTKNEPKESGTEIKFTNTNIKGTLVESMIKGAYAASYILTQRAETDTALSILGTLGDKALIDDANNAFTNDEYGKVEGKILKAITNKHRRFINGRDINYLPKEDAFCLLDVFSILQSDSNAYFYPYNPSFNYTRIGSASITKEGYPKFEPESNVRCKFSDLVWNKTRLNLSVRAKINGKIRLKNNYKKFRFTNNRFMTYVYRNYTIVRDGFLNVTIIPMSMSWDSYNKLKSEGLIDYDGKTWSDSEIFNIHLDRIPIINRTISNRMTSAKKLFNTVHYELSLMGYVKTYKFLKDELQPEKVVKASYFDNLTNDQINFLLSHGITNNGFNPPTEKEEPTDYYFSKEFEIKIAKLSSLPKVNDVRIKIEANKKLTLREEYIKAALDTFNIKCTQNNKVEWLDKAIDNLQKNLINCRTDIQKTKFAIVLGKKWFDEFSSREDNSMVVNDLHFSINLREKRIDI